MPPWHLEAHSEHEICFATYYDFTDQVPDEFQDPSGDDVPLLRGSELRQDPQSHHLILNRYFGSAPTCTIRRSARGPATAASSAGQACEPTDLSSCGSGHLHAATIQQSFACIGFGPQRHGGQRVFAIGGAQQAQAQQPATSTACSRRSR